MILSVMHTPNDNLIVLSVNDGVYTTQLYEPSEDGEREIGVQEAKDWQRSIRSVHCVAPENDSMNISDVR